MILNNPAPACRCSAPPAALQLLTARQVSGLLAIHVGSLWRLCALAEAGLPCNGFPKPLRLGPKTVRWRTRDIEVYLVALASAEARP